MSGLDKEGFLREVREHRVELNSIDDLMRINMKYRDLVPIILKYLEQTTDESDKQFLVRCLGVKGFSEASKPLIREFYRTNNLNLKWAIGNSLALIGDDSVLDDMLRIVCEREHGIARQMIIEGLGAFSNPQVASVLIKLLQDDEVVGHAILAISKIGDPSLVKELQPFKSHKVKWIRDEAAKAIKKLS